MKTTTSDDGTVTATFTFIDHYIFELKRVRDLVDEAITRLEHVDRDIRSDGKIEGRAYVPFNAAQAGGAMQAAITMLVELSVDFAGVRARFSPVGSSDGGRHVYAEELRPRIVEAKQHERAQPLQWVRR